MPIRIRLAVLFALATAVAVYGGGALYTRILARQLYATIDGGLGVQAQAVRAALAGGGSSRSVLATSSVAGRAELAQLYTPSGALVASSLTAGRRPLLAAGAVRRAGAAAPVFADPHVRLPAEDDATHVRLMATAVALPAGRRVLVVGTSLSPTDDAIDRVSDAALWSAPVVALLAGVAAWLLAGAALRPVERMRRQAAAMSAEQSSAGIAVPATRDELAALGRTMNDLLSRLHAALTRERAFVADAGHELRTPLAILQAELELAARPGRSPGELRHAVTEAADESQRISSLADDLLVLARDGADPARRRPTAVADLCAAAASAAAGRVAAGVRLDVDADAELVADVDPGRVRRLLDNLLDNAARHTPAGGSVSLAASARPGGVRFTVADTGPGFPPEFLPVAFERFARADTARGRDTGSAGLGLAIVRSVAEAHGGTARAANGPGGGAVVTVELPCAAR